MGVWVIPACLAAIELLTPKNLGAPSVGNPFANNPFNLTDICITMWPASKSRFSVRVLDRIHTRHWTYHFFEEMLSRQKIDVISYHLSRQKRSSFRYDGTLKNHKLTLFFKSFWVYFTKNWILDGFKVAQNWQLFRKMDIRYKTLKPLKLGYHIPQHISLKKVIGEYPFSRFLDRI
jgi:hypothetical protein